MDYEGTRDTDTAIELGDAALASTLPQLAAAAGAVMRTGGTPLVPDANNTVILPEGATLDDITVRGRDLVIQTDDGRTYVIADGAIFVPQIVAQGVTVPPLNLAALLIGNEPEPAAGAIRSSGGNFAVPVGSIQDAYAIGDLLPYTELKFPEPRVREIFPGIDRKPETGPNADVLLDDDAQAGGNPGGTGDDADGVNTSGTLNASGGDNPLTWSLSTAGAPTGFSYVANGTGLDVFQGAVRVLTVTLNPATGAYTVTQVAPIVHPAGSDENNQLFTLTYTVTDTDGDSATGTLGINVDDDSPVAANDTDSIAAGEFGPATGNILTDTAAGDAGDTDTGADRVGADGGLTLTAISGFTGAGTVGGTTDGRYGVLTLDGNGNYSYVRNPGTPGGVADTFTYTIRDGDGDTATATLTISITDAVPLTRENAVVALDDDVLGGNASGLGDDTPDTANLSGTLNAAGGDGALTWSLATTGAPTGFSYVANGTGINVVQGSTVVMTVTLNPATGAYTVTQVAPILHAPGNDENNQIFALTYTVTDIDGDPASGTLTINVDDDSPTATVSGKASPLVVDESAFASNDTQNLSTLFSHSFGADGAAAGGGVTYTLGVVAGPSGLVDTLTGQAVILSMNGNGVEGRTTGGLLVFTVAVDAAGHVTLDQSRAVIHDPNLGANDVETIGTDLVTLTQTVTDRDGDSTSAVAGIGDFLHFVDDAPAAANDTDDILSGSLAPATGNVLTDDAPGDLNDTDDGKDSVGADGGSVTAVASNNVPANTDNTLDDDDNLVVVGEFGTLTLNADGSYSYVRAAGTPGNSQDVFTYTVTDGDGDTTTATLTILIEDAQPVTAPNPEVQLDDDAKANGNPDGLGDVDPDTENTTGTLTGSGGDGALTWAFTSLTAPAGFTVTPVNAGLIEVRQGGTLVMSITLNPSTGAYTVTQNAQIDHPGGLNENDLSFTLNYSVTDADGDSAPGTMVINVDDDTPVVSVTGTAPNLTVDETNFTPNSTANLSGIFTHSFGADGAAAGGGVGYALGVVAGPSGLVDTLTGQAVNLSMNGSVVEGRTTGGLLVFTVSVDASGNVTLDQSRAVVHDPNLGPNDIETLAANLVTLTQTVTDGDSDSASATANIGDRLQFVDDAPSAGGNLTAFLNDDTLANGNPGGNGDIGAIQATTGTLSHTYGNDGGSLAFLTTGAPSGFQYVAAGSDILIQQNQGGTFVTVVTVTLNSTTGAYSITQNAPVLHPTSGTIEENQAFTLNYVVTDGDNDTAPSSLVIVVNDDTPVAKDDTDSVSEDGSITADGNVFSGSGGSDTNITDGVKDSIGADGAPLAGPVTAIAFGATPGTLGTALDGTYGALTIDAQGAYRYVLNNNSPLVQALDSGETRTDVFTYTITDRDGDTTTATLTITINGTNDAPVVTPSTTAVSEEGLALANPDTAGNTDTTNSPTATGQIIATDVDVEPLSYTLGTPTPALTSNGVPVIWTGAGTGTLTGMAGATPILTVTIDGSGNYTVTLLGHIDHPSTATEDSLGLTIPVNVSDGTATTPTTITVSIEDDSPIATTGTTSGTVDEDGLSGGIAGGTDDVSGAAITATGSVVGLFSGGADTAPQYVLTTTAGLPALTSGGVAITYSLVGNVLTATAGVTPIFTLSLNASTGTWTFTLQGPIDHANGANENDLVLNFAGIVQAVDTDGDRASATGTFSVTIDDDTPIANNDGTTQAAENTAVTIDVFLNDQQGADGALASTTALVPGSLTGTGTLVNNGNGTFTYTPGAGEEGTVTFRYTITDDDGDTSEATATITLLADSVPQVVNVVASVDDDGLGGNNPLSTTGDINANTGDLDGLASSEASYRGQLTVNFGNDTGAVSFANLHNTTGTVGTETVTYTWNAGTSTLTATGPRGALFTVTLTPSGAYTVTLLDNVLHANGGNETSAPVVNLNYLATDSDGDSNATGVVAITFNDDAPTAVNDGATQTAENAAVTIDVFTNDKGGADGALASSVTLVPGSLLNGVNPATGTLVNNGNGTFTYSPGAGEQGTVTFQYTITDADGDTSQATATITLLADSVPQPVNVVASVDDDGLGGNNPLSTTGDINANTGEPGATPSEAIYTGAIAVNFGNDTGTVSFANLHNTTGTVGTETVTYTWNAGTSTLTATGPRGALFTVSLTPSGAYTVTLLDNVIHAGGGNETSAPVVNLNYLATDSDGDSNATGVLAITFNDDAPTLGVVQNQQANNDPAQAPAVGTLHFAPGADGAGTAMTITANLAGITSGGNALVTSQAGNILTAYADITGNGLTGDDTAVFTLTVHPTAGTSGQYVFDLLAPLDTTVTDIAIGSGSSFGVGPSSSVIVTDDATALNLVLVTGWAPNGGFTAAEQDAWQLNGVPVMTQTTDVNGSTAGWGLGNNVFNNGEFMRFDFGTLNDYDGAGGYVPPAATIVNVTYATFSFFQFGAGDVIKFVAHYTDGSYASYTLDGATAGSTFHIDAPAGYNIAWIDTYMASGDMKINLTNVGAASTTIDETIPFTLQLTDADSDATTTASFSVHVGTNLAPLPPAPPVAIDLNGDGVHYLSTADGVAFDYNGDGVAEQTAWVDANDGLLAIDANGSGHVDSGSEIVFGGNGLTDLEGVAASYDSNADGVLDAQDAAFAQFGVWQDANGNGVSEAGEFKSLTALGIASLDLTSDGQAGTAAGGDVTVFGATTYTRTDGTTGLAADVAFATSALQRQAQPAELAAMSAAATGLLAAMALDHANAAADTGLRTAAAHSVDAPAAALPSLELPASAAQPAFAQVSSLAANKVAALADSHGRADHADTGRDHAALDKLADRGGDGSDTAAQAGAKSALFAAVDSHHAAMDALLTVAAPAQAKAAAAAQPAVAEALADVADNHAVDHIVDHFAATGAVELGASPKAGDFALQGLLDSSVQGSGHEAGASHFNLMQALDHEQAAALA